MGPVWRGGFIHDRCRFYISRALRAGVCAAYLGVLTILVVLVPSISMCEETSGAVFRKWGAESLGSIHSALWMSKQRLYSEEVQSSDPKPLSPAFMWGSGVQLSALVAAAQADGEYTAEARSYSDALQSYWTVHNGVGGYDVQPNPGHSDRYYDDNAWLVLSLSDLYEITKDAEFRSRAEKAFRFVLSGEDKLLSGGIYWRENERDVKGTCSNAPTAAGAIRLYQITGKKKYLADAKRLYDWTNSRLRDSDGLFWNDIKTSGAIEKRKWSYNSALMIRANCLFHRITGDRKYLAEAQRIAHAAEQMWVDRSTGAITDEAPFAHLLCEAFLALHDEDHDSRWLNISRRAAAFLHERVKDSNGHYGRRWDTPPDKPLATWRLIDDASAARAYWMLARH